MNKRKLQFVFILVISSVTSTIAQTNQGITYAIIVRGICKDKPYEEVRNKNISGLQDYLLKNTNVTDETVKVLISDDTENKEPNSSQFTNIQKVISNFESTIKSEDRLIFYYTGQANVANQQLRFNLPGGDITQVELAHLFKNIKADSILIVLDCPASGLAVKELSGKGRIIVCSCTDEQRFSMKFGEYFVAALSNSETDIDSDGKKSLLEVFISIAKNVEDWFQKEKLIVTETPVLDDNGDGKPSKEPWLYTIHMKDGLAASRYFFEKEL